MVKSSQQRGIENGKHVYLQRYVMTSAMSPRNSLSGTQSCDEGGLGLQTTMFRPDLE